MSNYRVHGFKEGTLSTGDHVLHHVFVDTVKFQTNFEGSIFHALIAATGTASLKIGKEAVGSSAIQIAVVTFSPGSRIGVVAGMTDPVTFVDGDYVLISESGTPDSTLAGVAITLLGEEEEMQGSPFHPTEL